jgi:hypothetical protein
VYKVCFARPYTTYTRQQTTVSLRRTCGAYCYTDGQCKYEEERGRTQMLLVIDCEICSAVFILRRAVISGGGCTRSAGRKSMRSSRRRCTSIAQSQLESAYIVRVVASISLLALERRPRVLCTWAS